MTFLRRAFQRAADRQDLGEMELAERIGISDGTRRALGKTVPKPGVRQALLTVIDEREFRDALARDIAGPPRPYDPQTMRIITLLENMSPQERNAVENVAKGLWSRRRR